MSLIASLNTLDNVIMAADSGTYDTASGLKLLIGNQKIFRQSVSWADGRPSAAVPFRADSSLHFLIGCAGSVRQRQLLQHTFFAPYPKDFTDSGLTGYMVGEYVPALYKALEEGHALGDDEKLEGTALIAVYGTGEANNRPHVYELLSDLQVCEVTGDWNATGANYEIALGVMAALVPQAQAAPPESIVRAAMDITSRYSMYCQPPFHVEHLIRD